MDVHEVPAGPITNVCMDAVITSVVEEQARLRPMRVGIRCILDRAAEGVSRPGDAAEYRRARLVLRMYESGWRRSRLPRGAHAVLARRAELEISAIAELDPSAA